MTGRSNEGVVLLHGIGRSSRSLSGLGSFLSKEGYEILNLSYPSTRLSLAELADHVYPDIGSFAARFRTVHFVGFSMGGLVIRAYLKANRPEIPSGRELGIIAGRNLFNPIASVIFKAPNDGKVSVASTWLPTARAHIVLKANHTMLPLLRKTHRETLMFLSSGRFSISG